jgi:hypothetical protein
MGDVMGEPACPLCNPPRPRTRLFVATQHYWVVRCNICRVPMVVYREHIPEEAIPFEQLQSMRDHLTGAVSAWHPGQDWQITDETVHAPGHVHWHGVPYERELNRPEESP